MIRLILPGKHCVCKHILPPFLMKMLFTRNDQLCIYATNAGSRTIPIQDRAEYTARQPRSVRYAQIDISISHYTEPAKLLTRRSCRATPPPRKKRRIGGDVPTQRSLASCAEEPDHETGPGGRRNHPLLRWREEIFRQQHVEENLRFCPSKPEHLLTARKKSTGALQWRSSTPTAQDWTCIRRP